MDEQETAKAIRVALALEDIRDALTDRTGKECE